MFLMHKPTGTLVEVLTLPDLFDPFQTEITGQRHAGEEMQDPLPFLKAEMVFPSGEALPTCWINSHYREQMAQSAAKFAVRA